MLVVESHRGGKASQRNTCVGLVATAVTRQAHSIRNRVIERVLRFATIACRFGGTIATSLLLPSSVSTSAIDRAGWHGLSFVHVKQGLDA